MKRGFRGARRNNDPSYRPYDPNFHPQDIIHLMSEGMWNCEIQDMWCISKATFYRWKKENEALEEAYQIGESKRKSFYIREFFNPMIEGKLEGKHSFTALKTLFDGELNYTQAPIADAKNTTINIGNMNVLKSPNEVIEQLSQNLKFLEVKNVMPENCKLIEGTIVPSQTTES